LIVLLLFITSLTVELPVIFHIVLLVSVIVLLLEPSVWAAPVSSDELDESVTTAPEVALSTLTPPVIIAPVVVMLEIPPCTLKASTGALTVVLLRVRESVEP
jgi:hypothetical protein